MVEKKPYVTIQSNVTIQVTPGLQNKDVTNPDAHVADRLKVSPSWPRAMVLILKGQHRYPSEIAEWPTVKALQKDKVLSIGTFVDEPDEEVAAKKEDLAEALADINKEDEAPVEEPKGKKLSDIIAE